jgi:hypothetical protein
MCGSLSMKLVYNLDQAHDVVVKLIEILRWYPPLSMLGTEYGA